MSIIYRNNCLTCKRPYEGRGRKYCSLSCYSQSVEKKSRLMGNKLSAGAKHWAKGSKTWKLSEATKIKHRMRIGILHNQWGRKVSAETRAKLSLAKIGKRTGSLSNLWKGGLTNIHLLIRSSAAYKQWRKKVFERDGYKCVWCGRNGGDLNADHIKPFSLYPELRLEVSNGRTLCVDCHKKTETYGFRALALKRV